VYKLFKDKRSTKVAVVAHCILNQNSRVLSIAKRSSIITEIMESLIRHDIGIVQMPCPELSYAGMSRAAQSKDQYDTPMFRKHCRKIARETADQIQEYAKCGIKTKLVIGIDGSPSCGVNETSKRNHGENTSKHEKMNGSGILIEELRFILKEKKISTPFHGIRYERLSEDIVEIERLLKH